MPPRASVEDVARDILRVATELGKTPTHSEYNDADGYSTHCVRTKFGSWRRGLRAVGLDPHIAEIETKDLITDLNRVADKIGHTPSKKDYKQHGEHAHRTVRIEFGTWNKGVAAAGLCPNEKKTRISDKILLEDLRNESEEGIAVKREEYSGDYHPWTIGERFDGWWAASVRAGLKPRSKQPLSVEDFHKFKRTAELMPPPDALHALLFLFTPVSAGIAEQLNRDWMQNRRESVIEVPPEYLVVKRPWPFKIPQTWINPFTGDEEDTHLPELLDWYWKFDSTVQLRDANLNYHLGRVARQAGLSDREIVERYPTGRVPQVTPEDLRMTHGIRLAARGIKSEVLHKQLGIKETGWRVEPEDIFLWLYVNEGYEHPEYNPTGVYFDPNSGTMRNRI